MKRRRTTATEHEEQKALFEWKGYMQCVIPELEMLYAVPNGGLRMPATAGKLRAEGVQSGVFDVALDVPRSGFHGLRIEMKADGGDLSPAQQVWKKRYEWWGYCAKVCVGWLEARAVILEYLHRDDGLKLGNCEERSRNGKTGIGNASESKKGSGRGSVRDRARQGAGEHYGSQHRSREAA